MSKLATPTAPDHRLWPAALAVGALIFLLSLVGVLSRPAGSLAAMWPANAVLLGLMIRSPLLRSGWCWLAASGGFIAADLVTGSPFYMTWVLTLGNLAGVAAGLRVALQVRDSLVPIEQGEAILRLVGVALGASLAAGFAGMVINPLLFGGSIGEGWAYWSVTEFVNYIAFLPAVLAIPTRDRLVDQLSSLTKTVARPTYLAPVFTLLLLTAVATVFEGPGAFALPLVALLWCALLYSVFATAVLTLCYCVWTLLGLALGYIPLSPALTSWENFMSLRVTLSLMALTPVVVACHTTVRVRQMAELLYSARHDSLTGAMNRRSFLDLLDATLAGESRLPPALLLIDLDHFKSINDCYGHPVGDQVLQHFYEVARACLRREDSIGRLGGEEFGVLLTHCDEAEIVRVAQRIRESFAQQTLRVNGRSISATLSVGIAIAHAAGEDRESLVNRADRALYRAKSAGRDRVEACPGEAVPV